VEWSAYIKPAALARWAFSIAFVGLLLLIGTVVGGWNAPNQTLFLTGPAYIQDTWISQQYMESTVRFDDPAQRPFAEYAQAPLTFNVAAEDRLLFYLDISQLPPQSEVLRAEFKLYLEPDPNTPNTPAQVSLFTILSAWLPETATFIQPWEAPGLRKDRDYTDPALDTRLVQGSGWIIFDITHAVRQWQSSPEANHGLMAHIISADSPAVTYWATMTEGDQNQPEITITYR
jgi:hypothetical protein